jgi:MFS family permease
MNRFFKSYQNLFNLPNDSDPEIAHHFRRNFIVNGLDSATWLFGASFISVAAVLPVYARHITDSAIVIGLIPALTDFGFYIPQLFLAPTVERRPRKFPLVLILGFVERLPYLFLPFAALWLDDLNQKMAVLLFILLMAWKSIGSGIVAIPWQEMIAKIIPVTHRGRYFGLSHLVGQFMGVGGAALAALVLAVFPYPQNFAISFGLGNIGIWLSYLFLSFTIEPSRPVPPIQHEQGKYHLRLKQILNTDTNYRTYLVSRWLSYLGTMAFGFVAVFGVEQFFLPDSMAGIYTSILFATGVAGYFVWGPLGDHLGHKHVMELTILLWILALVTIILTTITSFQLGLVLAFALMGFGSAGSVLSDFNLTMEFGPEAERPTYIGLARAITAPALLLAPILGGWIAQSISYPALFIFSLSFAIIGVVILRFFVEDPRYLQKKIEVT